ncbi:MAG: zinc-ribbon domain-containing protein [Thermodesulfobacteriota bacterium]|nr:zinc-ribbon domain-containing protein [Thermodesulfobacteriota bacterium]
MILECDKCNSRFNLDESLLTEGGSMVRCSQCKNVFMAYPPEPVPIEEPSIDQPLDEDLEESVIIDYPPSDGMQAESLEDGMGADFDESFEEVLEEEPEETISLDELPDPEEEYGAGDDSLEEDFDMAFKAAMEEDEIQAISPDDIPDLDMVETVDMEGSIDVAAKMEEEKTRETEEKVEERPNTIVEAPLSVPLREKPGRFRSLIIVFVTILLLLTAAVTIFFVSPGLIPDSLSFLRPTKKSEITDVGVRRLSFKAVNGSFIKLRNEGQRFIIKGTVINNYPRSRSFILLKGSILDDKGRVVKKMLVYAGNTYTEKQISEMSLKELSQGLKNRDGIGKININIKPGGAVPFMIIFENLPDNISEFTVEGVSSSPGK